MSHLQHEETSEYVEVCRWSPETGEWFIVDSYRTTREAMEEMIKTSGRYRRQTIIETIITITE